MLNTYRQILTKPGSALFSATGLVARLPISMVGLGIVLLVEDASGSYGVAGAVSAAHLLANALFAVLQGKLVDRLGQSRVLPVVVSVWGVALALLMWSVESDWPTVLTYALAVLAGASLPSVGSCVRARWSYVARDPQELQTAFALEAVADEAVFIVGPILVTVLATAIHPVAGLTTALVVGVLGTYAFAAQRSTEPPPHLPTADRSERPRMPWRVLAPLGVVSTMLGVLFGAAEVATVAFAEEQDAKAYAGALLALWAAGSLIAGVLSGAVAWRRGPAYRLRWGTLAMALVMAPLTFIDSLVVMGAVLFVAGFAVAPTLISTMSLCEQVVPAARITEGMALLQTGLVAGVAPGAALAGVLIDSRGAAAAYLVPVVGGALAVLAAQAIRTSEPTTVSPVMSHD
ncbi:MFS transporter [Nocardioides sp. cx-173]|uniref:MFS transporter n=1 Tax=Nocardioides sp. cx-173 TaxID=2898796 RepID=UPI001E3B4A19|nr:MFS transporter [Nocardioides sp. cx-173]MCD4527332.1 MFS transporter [Nocardioides sp. cx-173]UGB43630.1 MFS transporter [Nocardioides sp. cx-173]